MTERLVSTETGTTWGCGNAHHYVLESPANGRVPGKCRDCDAVKDWPETVTVDPGRPMILRDPLMPRLYNAGYAGPRGGWDYY